MNNTTLTLTTAVLVIVLAILLANPFGTFMPEPAVMLLIAGLFVFFVLLALFVFKELPRDEREEMLRSKADRVAFIVGGSVLVLGIGLQGFQHAVDPWLVFALVGMIISKNITHLIR